MVSSDWPSMSMKPGATTMPCASMVRLRGAPRQIADGGDLAVADADVARIPGRAGAVDDVAVGDDEDREMRSRGLRPRQDVSEHIRRTDGDARGKF